MAKIFFRRFNFLYMKISIHLNYINYRKNTCPAFAGRVSVFSKRMDKLIKSSNPSKAENLNLMNLLKKIINKKTKEQSILGEGCRGIVFSLDSKYVL